MSNAVNINVKVSNAGVVVSDAVLAELWANLGRRNPYRREPTWEERLAQAIEQRSLGFRWHRFRNGWSYRLSTAWAVLRGRHECD